jgi:hypothetical protein
MASEALDIKSLTTLVLATPKTDIVQAVGRILRVKHARPLVIDIVDSHEVFLSQWQKRRKYYLQNKYCVMHTKSHLYVLDQWDQPAAACEKAKAKEKPKSNSKSNSKPNQKINPSNLLMHGAAAAAQFVNTDKYDNHNAYGDDDDLSMLKGRCFI